MHTARRKDSGQLLTTTGVLLFVLLAIVGLGPAAHPAPPERVSIQLKWTHGFQFAGYYAAIEKGYYAQAGLEVTLREIDLQRDIVEQVLSGEADYGTADSGLLVHHLRGEPVVLVNQIFQQSPLVLLTRADSGIVSPYQMIGKRIAFDASFNRDIPLIAMLTTTLGDLARVEQLPFPANGYQALIDGDVDALPAYSTALPYELRSSGIDVNVVNPQSYGIDFYGDNLFTSRRELERHPDRVRRVSEATLKGWAYALQHPDEIIRIIRDRYAPGLSEEFLQQEAVKTRDMILPQLIELGSVDPKRFERIARIYRQLGISRAMAIDAGFFYTPAVQVAPVIELTADEAAWLAANREVRVGGGPGHAPINFVDDDGTQIGISTDFLRLVAEKTGLTFVFDDVSWSEQLHKLEAKQLDIVGAAYYTQQRAAFAIYSMPYFETLDRLYVRRELRDKSLRELAGKRVAMPRGYAHRQVLARYYPMLDVVEVNKIEDAVTAVRNGDADVLYNNDAAIRYTLRKLDVDNIVPFAAGGHSDRQPIHLITRNDQPLLASIIQKGLDAITEEEKLAIHDRWIGPAERAMPENLQLSGEERQWLDANPVIRLRIGSSWPPYEFSADGGPPQGFTVDVIRMIEQRLGIRFDIVSEYSWAATLAKAERREIDVVSSIASTPARDAYLLFTDTYISPNYAVFMRRDSGSVNSLDELNGRTVAVENQYRMHEILQRQYPGIRLLLVEKTADALRAVSYGQADAYIGNQGTANWLAEQNVLTNLHLAHIPRELGAAELRFGIRKDWPMLQQLFNKALSAIPEVEMQQARRRWLGTATGSTRLALTQAERDWLARHRVVRFTGDPDWLPYEAFDGNGNYIGIVAEYLQHLEQKLGIRFEIVPSASWSQSVEMARNGGVDVLSESPAEEWQDVLTFTRPYLSSPIVIVMRDDESYVEDLQQIRDRRIAVIRDYGYVPEIQRAHPTLDYHEVESIREGLTAVSTGNVDALFATLAQASYQIAELGVGNVRIVGTTEFTTRLSLGVRKELSTLVPLLDRALASITRGERQRIADAWGGQKALPQTDFRQLLAVIAGGLAVIAVILAWNLTIRRQRERLRHSEERYQAAMEAVSEAVWEWDLTTDARHFSSGFFTRIGYPADEIPTTQAQWIAMIHPEDRAAFNAGIREHVAGSDRGRSMLCMNYRLRTRDGGYVDVESRGRVVAWDAAGNATMRRGTLRDITEQHRAIDALKQSERWLQQTNKRFALAAKAISIGVWQYRLDGSKRMWVDDRLCEMYGFARRDHVMLDEWYDRVHPDDRAQFRELAERVLNDGGDAHTDFRAYHTDGRLLHIYSGFAAIKGEADEPDQLVGVNWDITERKQAEERFEKLLNALPVAVAIADDEGRILFANPQAQREFGGDLSLVGMSTEDYYADSSQRATILTEVQKRGQILGLEIRYKTGKGEIVEGLLSAIPVTFEGRSALLGVVVNITERRNMERELSRAKEEAEEANEFKGRFLANMSHEIRTPMNAIVGLGHLLSRTSLSPRQQDYLSKIQISARSLLNIIDDILDFSKIEAGELRIERIDFDLNEVLDSITTLAGTQLAEKPVEFIYDIDADVPSRLIGDPHRLTQILTNLVGNATKFTAEGSIVVRLRVAQAGDPIRLSFVVEDTGIGIDSDKLEKLFSPFVQADGSTTRDFGGTGLGLSICRQLTGLMGGHISADSRPRVGSRFEFELPFDLPVGKAVPRRRASVEGARVLLVDDNAITREVLADLLVSLSFRVDVTSGCAAALDKLQDAGRRFDIVLVDWRMPEIDGFETARRIRAADLIHQPRIIMMTAYGREAIEHALDLSEIDGFLVKPLTPSHLLDAVNQVLGGQPPEIAGSVLDGGSAPTKALRGHVLLVEDNTINQQVARELLEQMGATVDVAANGVQALALLEQARYDLVLMDIQMPDMDGFEVTARIRADARYASLPIVAMTANAMAGDAERSLDAGMNGHIAKPVDPDKLYGTLHAWLKGTQSTANVGVGAATGASMARPGQDDVRGSTAIEFDNGIMRVGGNRALYAKLLRGFVDQFGSVAGLLGDGDSDAGMADIEHRLHSLKGVSGNIGARNVQQVATEIEHWARLRDTDRLRQGLPSLNLALDEAIAAATRFLASEPARPSAHDKATAAPVEDTPALLAEIAALLHAGDASVIGRVDVLSNVNRDATSAHLVEKLRREVADYDFDLAAVTLDQLKQHTDDVPSSADGAS